jgi:hypothetical protein
MKRADCQQGMVVWRSAAFVVRGRIELEMRVFYPEVVQDDSLRGP